MAAVSGLEAVELRYRALTHHNPGRCRVTVHPSDEGRWVCVAEDCDGHLGPRVRWFARPRFVPLSARVN